MDSSSTISATSTTPSSSSSPLKGRQPCAVVVGGGPGGLAASIMLAEKGYDVKVLEKREAVTYEPTRAYLYLIDARGQKFTERFNLTDKLKRKGVSSLNYTIARVYPDKRGTTRSVPPMLSPDRKASYWISRYEMLKLLTEKAEEYPNIEIHYGSSFTTIDAKGDQALVSAGHLEFTPDLIVGADGVASKVREVCAELSGDHEGFEPIKYPSASSNLRYKMITLPPRFPLNKEERSEGRQAYAIYSKVKDPKKKGKLGLLPVAQEDSPRTANIIQKPDHVIWDMKDGDQVMAWLSENFPHIPIADIVSKEEAAAFASERGGQFPDPQYTKRIQATIGANAQGEKGTTCVLVGDSIHAFPPDLGQGVNAALDDVCDFEAALDAAAEAKTGQKDQTAILKTAAQSYEKLRVPESEGLIKVMQIGFPYQYGQDPLAEKLWMVNFVLRSFVLSKILPRVFYPAAVIMLQDATLRYSEVWRREQQTTRRLFAFLGLGAALVFFRQFMPLLLA
uniref:FAD-binding domain-containing protein n=1 Tax=Lotharella globosa TaxID=91324 RepID=A0A7S3ZD29_9EUKA